MGEEGSKGARHRNDPAEKEKTKQRKQTQRRKKKDKQKGDEPRVRQHLPPPPGLDVNWVASRHKVVGDKEKVVKTVTG